MEQPIIHYEFINSETGNVIGYLSLPGNVDKSEQLERLKKKRIELAISNNLYLYLIYWQEQEDIIE